MTKNPAPPSPSAATVSPALKVRSLKEPVRRWSSRDSRPAKSGIRCRSSTDGPATPEILIRRGRTAAGSGGELGPESPAPGGAGHGRTGLAARHVGTDDRAAGDPELHHGACDVGSAGGLDARQAHGADRSEEHTSELQSPYVISYA